MNRDKNNQRLLVVTVLSLVVAACSHNQSPAGQVSQGFAPFSTTRNQAVGLVSTTKGKLSASDINSLDVAYTKLEEKANTYASFMVEAIRTSSFDPAKNQQYAADLTTAIGSFDNALASLTESHQPTVAAGWLPTFAQSLQTNWDRYNGAITKMSPETKANLIADVKRNTVWPNYEDISTEAVAGSR